MAENRKEWKIVRRTGDRTETLEIFVSDKREAIDKLLGRYLDLKVDRELVWNELHRTLTDETGKILYSPGYRIDRIGDPNDYVELVKTGLFEIESNVPIEVIVDKEESSAEYPIRIDRDDEIINPIEYDFRNRIDPRRNLNSEDLKEILGNLETITFWGSTILSRLNKIEAEIFSDVLRDIAEVLRETDKKIDKNYRTN